MNVIGNNIPLHTISMGLQGNTGAWGHVEGLHVVFPTDQRTKLLTMHINTEGGGCDNMFALW